MKNCAKCGKKASIMVNTLANCDVCFCYGFERKIRKQLSLIKYKENIAVLLSDTNSPFKELLQRLILNSKILFVKDNENEDRLQYLQKDQAFQEAIKGCSVVVTCETMDDLAVYSLRQVCKGSTKNAVEYLSCNYISECIALIRPFSEITNKELAYWLYLSGKKYTKPHISKKDPLSTKIEEFLGNIKKKNKLVYYNIISTLKKLKATKDTLISCL